MPHSPQSPSYRSRVAIYELATRTSRVVFEGDGIIEAPNWARDGSYLLVNRDGALFRLPLPEGGSLSPLALTPGNYECNNDHDLSPDGRLIAFSAATADERRSRVFVANADGTEVRLVTPNAPSYFHGWSPDGQWLAFIAERGDGRYEVYRIGVGGGPEERLTTLGGYDDGSEYAPDGRWIYFNSNRSGGWAIWRMPPSGAGAADALAERVTFGPGEDWFPHLSPDGQWLLFLSFPPGTQGHDDRVPGMKLRLQPAPRGRVEPTAAEVLTEFFGGQGTINVNSWSPDSKRFAYVMYEPVGG